MLGVNASPPVLMCYPRGVSFASMSLPAPQGSSCAVNSGWLYLILGNNA